MYRSDGARTVLRDWLTWLWALPNTLIGLLLAVLARGRLQRRGFLFEAHGGDLDRLFCARGHKQSPWGTLSSPAMPASSIAGAYTNAHISASTNDWVSSIYLSMVSWWPGPGCAGETTIAIIRWKYKPVAVKAARLRSWRVPGAARNSA